MIIVLSMFYRAVLNNRRCFAILRVLTILKVMLIFKPRRTLNHNDLFCNFLTDYDLSGMLSHLAQRYGQSLHITQLGPTPSPTAAAHNVDSSLMQACPATVSSYIQGWRV